MRTITLVFSILIFTVSGVFGEDLPDIAVMPFEGSNLGEGEAAMPDLVQALFETALHQIGQHRVIERSEFGNVLDGLSMQPPGHCDRICAAGIGELLGADFIVIGRVGKLGNTYPLTARIFGVQQAELLNTAAVVCPKVDDVALGSEELAYRLLAVAYQSKITRAINFAPAAPVPTPQTLPRVCIRHQARGGRGIKESDWVCADGSFESEWMWTGDDTGYRHQKLRILSTGEYPVCIQYTASRGIRRSDWACSSRSEESEWIWVGDDTGYRGQQLRVRSMGPEEVCIRHSRFGGRVIESEWSCSANGDDSPWIAIGDDTGYRRQQLKIKVGPAPRTIPRPQAPVVETPDNAAEWLQQLTSGIVEQENAAAQGLYRYHRADPSIYQTVREVLLAGYATNLSNDIHVDSMAWLCKILGSMDTPANAAALRTVVNNCIDRKIKKCAKDALKNFN